MGLAFSNNFSGTIMPDFGTSALDDLQALLDSYTVHATGANEPPTLMEIAGFPQWENVYSNILAFLLNSEQVHGFGPLFIRSIMAIYSSRCPDGWPKKGLDPESVQATEKVERETSTATNNRIDILIECEDFVVCIENKIWSGLHNDLGEYREHCKTRCDGNPERVVGIVLSPHDVSNPSLRAHRFVSITYGDLVDDVRRRIGSYIGSHNTRYQYLLFDFLEQAERFSRTNTMSDDQRKFLEFWRKNVEKINNIQSMCDAMKRDLVARNKAQAHIDQCKDRLTERENEVFKTRIYTGNVSVFDLADDGRIEGCGLFLDVEFHPLRVTHSLGKRRGDKPDALASKIGRKCGKKFVNSSGRPSLSYDQSPFDESVCEKAVGTSVAILKEIAAIRLKPGN